VSISTPGKVKVGLGSTIWIS
ncbi:unnamed protein product, partial [Allacma fusca]